MRIEVLTAFPVSREWAAQWDSLVTRSAIEDVFVTYQWTRAAAEFDPQAQPLIVCGYASDAAAGEGKERLIGLAPLTVRRCRDLVRRRGTLELLAGPWADYCDLIVEPAHQPEFTERVAELAARRLRERTAGCAKICLNNLPDSSPTLSIFARVLASHGLRAEVRQVNLGPTLEFAGADQAALDELLEKKGVVRKAKTLAKKGKLEFRIVREAGEVRACLQQLYRFHTARYLLNGQPGIYDPERRESLCLLLDSLAEKLAPSGGICLPTLFFNDRPIALTLGFEYGQALTLYAMTFDIGVTGTSPGEILVLEIARYCRAAGLKKLDFGAGDEAYKARFTNHQRRTFELVARRNSVAAIVATALSNGKARIKRNEALHRLIRQVKGFVFLLQLEAHRTSALRAVVSLLLARSRVLLTKQKSAETITEHLSHHPLTPAADLIELRTDELVETVMQYRHVLPAWEFKRAYELLRQGHRCFIALENGRFGKMISQQPVSNELKLSQGRSEA